MLTAYQKIALGTSENVKHFRDLSLNEKLVIVPLVIMIFWIGVYPKPFLDIAGPSIDALRHVINRDTGISLTN
jgi:NADH-quinone oxidoreductase subunit M